MAVKAANLDNRGRSSAADAADGSPTIAGEQETPVSTIKVLTTPTGGVVVFDHRFVVRLTSVDGNGTFTAVCQCRRECDHAARAVEYFQFYGARRERSRNSQPPTTGLAPRASQPQWTQGDDIRERPYDGPARDVAEADVLPAATPGHAWPEASLAADSAAVQTVSVIKADRGPVWATRCPSFAYGADGVRLPYADARDAMLFATELHAELDRRSVLLAPALRRTAGYFIARPPFTADTNTRGGTWHAPDVLLRLAYAGSWELKYGGVGARAEFVSLEPGLDDEETAS